MLTIALERLKFYAHHGYYQEETIIGNYFILDISVKIAEPAHPSSLDGSVNYEVLYAIAAEVMKTPQLLLEQVVQDISASIKKRYPAILYTYVSLRKQAPPLGGDVAYSKVALEKQY